MSIRGLLAIGVSVAGLVSASGVPASAAADDPIRWGKVSGWDVMIDPTLGNGCFIYTLYDAGTELRLGFDPDNGEAYMMVGNAKWGSIEEGKDYDIEVKMDRDSPWLATATGANMGGLPILWASTDEPNFLVDFAKKKGLQVIYQGKTIASLNLSGTYAAVSEMLKCQDQVDKFGIGNRRADPFASSSNRSSGSSDPFKR
jgi:hypothetical protein